MAKSTALTKAPEPMNRDRLFESAATAYFDLLAETGKPPTTRKVAERTGADIGVEAAMVKSQLGPDWDAYMVVRRKRRITEELALKVAAAEFAEKIQGAALSRLVDLLDDPESKVSAKDLIAAAKLASDLNAQVDASMSEATGTNNLSINLKVKNILVGLPPERRAAFLGEVMRQGTVLELEDAGSDED